GDVASVGGEHRQTLRERAVGDRDRLPVSERRKRPYVQVRLRTLAGEGDVPPVAAPGGRKLVLVVVEEQLFGGLSTRGFLVEVRGAAPVRSEDDRGAVGGPDGSEV